MRKIATILVGIGIMVIPVVGLAQTAHHTFDTDDEGFTAYPAGRCRAAHWSSDYGGTIYYSHNDWAGNGYCQWLSTPLTDDGDWEVQVDGLVYQPYTWSRANFFGLWDTVPNWEDYPERPPFWWHVGSNYGGHRQYVYLYDTPTHRLGYIGPGVCNFYTWYRLTVRYTQSDRNFHIEVRERDTGELIMSGDITWPSGNHFSWDEYGPCMYDDGHWGGMGDHVSYVWVDNIWIHPLTPGPADVAVSIKEPPQFLSGGMTYTPKATVENKGSDPANNVTVACSIWTLGSLVYNDERTIPTLNGWSVENITFDDWYCDADFCGQPFIVKMSSDFSDAHPENNVDEDTCIVVEILLAEWNFEPTDDGFTHTTYRCDRDCWEWGAPSRGSARRGGWPGTPPTEPNCWGTEIDNYYPTYAGSRLLSPVVDLPTNSKKIRLRFKHWYYVYWRYAGGNVKASLDGEDFERIDPVGGYPSSVRYGCLSGERAYTYYGSGGWKDVIFDIPLETPKNTVQFAWDFGSYRYNSWSWMRCWGWAVDNVRVFVRYPPLSITDMGGIPAIAGINCCYTPTMKVKNQTDKPLMGVEVIRHLTPAGDTVPLYVGYATINELAKGAEQEVTFEEWCAPSTPNIFLYDSAFAGFAGVFLDTLFRIVQVRVDVGEHEPIEPTDTIYTDTSYRPMARLQALVGCDVPTHVSLTLQDSTAHPVYYSEQDIILPHGSTEYTFDSLKVDDPGYYTFVLVTQTEGDSIFTNDTLRWDVRALTRGALDVGTETILVPSKANPGDSIVPKAIVKNYGTVRATNFDVECTIDPDGYSDTKTITGIDPGGVDTVEFAIWVVGDSPEHTVTVTTKLAGDENPGNDSKSKKVTGIAEPTLPTKFALSCIRPNPFTKNTVISYQLPAPTKVSLAVYDITGKLVKVLVSRYSSPGYYTITWDGKDVPAGIYFVKLITPEFKATRKIVLTR